MTVRRKGFHTCKHEHPDADAGRHGPALTGDAAKLANVSRETIYREIDRGALPALHVGRQLRIDPVEFRSYMRGGEDAA